MIVTFTGGDKLEEDDEILLQYLDRCPKPLKEALKQCGNRQVLFDNKTEDPLMKGDQLRNLLLHVESKLREMGHIEAELAKERDARLEAEQIAKAALMHYEKTSHLLRESSDR
ncbi:GTPase IMAP member 7 [Datura stramonium]|uniref:GTPase IMAP member 7 n=1 Tax=Datura stramonium TaxID=4076 RepID=A0ABS8W3A6_DATST|nr:GTPase IMAP member 7 [Datura stramonium]